MNTTHLGRTLRITTPATPPVVPFFITTVSPLPTVFQDIPFSLQLETDSTQTPVTWRISSGTITPGLTLSESGLLSGTPTTIGDNSFTVEATDSQPYITTKPFEQAVTTAPAPEKPGTPSWIGSSSWAPGYENVYWIQNHTVPELPFYATHLHAAYSFDGGSTWEGESGDLTPGGSSDLFAAAANTSAWVKIIAIGPGGQTDSDMSAETTAPAPV